MWIVTPIQGRIIDTIYPGIYCLDLTQLFPEATLAVLSGKEKKRWTELKEFGHCGIAQK